MNFADWEPAYEAILADLGYDRAADERARDRLAERCEPFDLDRLAFGGKRVAVAGAARSLADDLDAVGAADAVIAASSAAEVLCEAGVGVDLVTTDLDKTPAVAVGLSRAGVPVAVHAHGDNVAALEAWLGRFDGEQVLPTTQARPRGPVENFGGFTDGDRGAFLADHLGAEELRFPGWDFDDPTVGETKRRKLRWAERLLRWLELRRGERFGVLDGRRDDVDLPFRSA